MHPIDTDPFVVTLGFDVGTFDRLDALRTRFFPPHRNIVPAHVSLFHALPGDEEERIRSSLAAASASFPPIELAFPGLQRLGGGMVIRVDAPALIEVRARLVHDFAAWLTPQDRQPFRPHVTIMNKAEKSDAERAFAALSLEWSPWGGLGASLELWRYRGGPWESVASYPFGGDSATMESRL